MIGGSVAGIDKRFRTFVLIVGLEGFVRHYRESPIWADMRRTVKKSDFDHLLLTLAPLDAAHFIGKSSPTPLLFQAARFDPGVPEAHTRDFFKLAGEPKELRWYDTGHDMNDPQPLSDRVMWLRTHLKIQ